MLKRMKVLTGYSQHARFLARCAEQPIGEILRQADIPSPYFYSPTWQVLLSESYGPVVIVETKHIRYEVFHVPQAMIRPTGTYDGPDKQ